MISKDRKTLMLYVAGGIAFVFIAFIWWRYTSVERGARHRDGELLATLNPIMTRLKQREAVLPAEIAELARQPQYRPMLYFLLEHHKQLDLFPPEYLSIVAQGEGILVHWMMHPNELQAAPNKIELVEELDRQHDGKIYKFLVYRYQMPEGHWAAKDGWLLGLVGPFTNEHAPYTVTSAFSRCGDKQGEVKPAELVDWYVGIS